MSDETGETRPVLRIIRGGAPSDEELAALVAVMTARTAASADDAPARSLRTPLTDWVASGLVKGTRTKA